MIQIELFLLVAHCCFSPVVKSIILFQLDLLYEEAIYTVVNRVGVPSPEYVTSEGDIFNYLQKVRLCYLLNKDLNTPTSFQYQHKYHNMCCAFGTPKPPRPK